MQPELASTSRKQAQGRRKLCKSKSLSAKLTQQVAAVHGSYFQIAGLDALSLDSEDALFMQVKYDNQQLSGFILKHMLKPLVAELAKVDLAAPENEVCCPNICKFAFLLACNAFCIAVWKWHKTQWRNSTLPMCMRGGKWVSTFQLMGFMHEEILKATNDKHWYFVWAALALCWKLASPFWPIQSSSG